MKFANFHYVEYSDEEFQQREKAQGKGITFDDLRKFLKDSGLGFELHKCMFNELDSNLFKGNCIVHIQDKKKVLQVREAIDLIVENGPQYTGKNENERECLNLAAKFFEEQLTTAKKVYKLFTTQPLTSIGMHFLEKKQKEFMDMIDSRYTYRAGITPEYINMADTHSNREFVASIKDEWKEFVDSKNEKKNNVELFEK